MDCLGGNKRFSNPVFCPSFLESALKTARKEILKDTGDEAPEDSPLQGDGADFLGIPPSGQTFFGGVFLFLSSSVHCFQNYKISPGHV